MATERTPYPTRDTSLEARCDAMLLGRLGSELANIYGDTLHAPLPAALQSLIDRLDTAIGSSLQTPRHAARRSGG